MIEVTCSDVQKDRLQVKPTSGGVASKIQAGSLVVTPVAGGLAVNPIATVESDDTFTVQADLPADGSVTVDQDFEVSGDADVGAGVETIKDIVRLHVNAAKADALGVSDLGAVAR